jgi:hypothetical protein
MTVELHAKPATGRPAAQRGRWSKLAIDEMDRLARTWPNACASDLSSIQKLFFFASSIGIDVTATFNLHGLTSHHTPGSGG